jgi:hypothetical protein
MAVGFPTKVTYADGDVFSASDINDTNGTLNLLGSSVATTAGKNGIINGAMQIWQRGTSLAVTSSSTGFYSVDRFNTYRAATGSTVSRQTTSDTTNLPTIQYCARVQRDSGNSSTTNIFFAQALESSNSYRFAGQTVTLSFYARKGANYSAASSALGVKLQSGTGTDNNIIVGFTGNTDVISQTATLTTTWQRFTYSGTVGASATQVGALFTFTPVGTAGANDHFEITGVQIEQGSTATAFQTATGSIQGELAACQRYYWRATAVQNYSPFGWAIGNSAGLGDAEIVFPVFMRVAPTSVDYSTLVCYDGTNLIAVSSLTLTGSGIGVNVGRLALTMASGLTSFRMYQLAANNSTSAYVGFSAEL